MKRPPGILLPWTNGQQGGRHWPGVGNRGSAIRVAGSFSLRPGQLDVPRMASSLGLGRGSPTIHLGRDGPIEPSNKRGESCCRAMVEGGKYVNWKRFVSGPGTRERTDHSYGLDTRSPP